MLTFDLRADYSSSIQTAEKLSLASHTPNQEGKGGLVTLCTTSCTSTKILYNQSDWQSKRHIMSLSTHEFPIIWPSNATCSVGHPDLKLKQKKLQRYCWRERCIHKQDTILISRASYRVSMFFNKVKKREGLLNVIGHGCVSPPTNAHS